MVLQMTQIGEESGSLDGMLTKIAEFYEREVDDAVAALAEPARADHHRLPRRRDRRSRRRDVSADIQARRRHLKRAPRVATNAEAAPASGGPYRRVGVSASRFASRLRTDAGSDLSDAGRAPGRTVRRQFCQCRDPPAAEDARARLGGAVRGTARRGTGRVAGLQPDRPALRVPRVRAPDHGHWRTSRSSRG